MAIRWIVPQTTPPEPVVTYFEAGDDFDQVFFNLTNSSIFRTQNYVRLFAPNEVGYMRFPNITIPQGSTITEAYMQVVLYSNASGTVIPTIRANDVDDAPQVETAAQGQSLVLTSESSDSSSPAQSAGETYVTSDFSNVVQEVVDRPGWVSGNAIGLYISLNTGIRFWSSYHNRETLAQPQFHVTYQA